MSNAKFGIDIVANDKTAKGVGDATKRVSGITKKINAANDEGPAKLDRAWRRSGASIVKTFGAVEKASARALGSTSITGGITSKLAALGAAGAAMGEGFGVAAESAGLVATALGPVGIAAAATAAVIGAVAVATDKMVTGWAKGIVGASQLASTIGVATKALQEFQGAGERLGIDQNTSASALAGLSQSLNDARYNRNNGAIALLSRWGMKLQLNADGTVNTEAMLPQIANAISRQNSSGRRLAASILGIPEAALPLFAQGGAALSGDMADTGRIGAVANAGQVEKARRWQRQRAILGQMAQRAGLKAGDLAAGVAEPVLDATVGAGRGIIGGTTTFGGVVKNIFAPAANLIERGGKAIERAATALSSAAGTGILGLIPEIVGRSPAMAAYLGGVAKVESGLNPNAKAPTSSATGLYQFTEGTWLDMMRRHGASHGLGWAAQAIAGGSLAPAMRAKILAMRTDPRISTLLAADLANDNAPALAAALGHAPTAGDLYMGNFLGAGGASRFFRLERRNPNAAAAELFPREAQANRSIFYDHGRERSLAEVHQLMDRKIEIALKVEGLPHGTKVTARSKTAVAVSHATAGGG